MSQTLWLIRNHAMTLPTDAGGLSSTRKEVSSSTAGRSSAARKAIRTYLHLAGIETGYSYFAPSIPRNYDLAFDVYLPNGDTEHVPVSFGGSEERLRWFSLMDYLGRNSTGQLREVILKLITHSVRQDYPDAVRMRAIVGTTISPSLGEFQKGNRESHRILSSYEFSFSAMPAAPAE